MSSFACCDRAPYAVADALLDRVGQALDPNTFCLLARLRRVRRRRLSQVRREFDAYEAAPSSVLDMNWPGCRRIGGVDDMDLEALVSQGIGRHAMRGDKQGGRVGTFDRDPCVFGVRSLIRQSQEGVLVACGCLCTSKITDTLPICPLRSTVP